jgi:hypothetical protein
MLCYECSLKGVERQAIGICHNCSIGICLDHARKGMTLVGHRTDRGFAAGVVSLELPERAERLLCPACNDQLQRQRLAKTA